MPQAHRPMEQVRRIAAQVLLREVVRSQQHPRHLAQPGAELRQAHPAMPRCSSSKPGGAGHPLRPQHPRPSAAAPRRPARRPRQRPPRRPRRPALRARPAPAATRRRRRRARCPAALSGRPRAAPTPQQCPSAPPPADTRAWLRCLRAPGLLVAATPLNHASGGSPTQRGLQGNRTDTGYLVACAPVTQAQEC